MIDLKFLRENTDYVKKAITRKKFTCDIDPILELDNQRRDIVSKAEDAKAKQKAVNQEMAQMDKSTDAFKEKVAEMKQVATHVKELEAQAKEIDEQWHKLFLTIPNIPHESVPQGKTEEDNVVFKTWGEIDAEGKDKIPHYDLPNIDKLLDFARGAKVTGAGFPFYKGSLAKLVRSLLQFFLDEASGNGYTEVICPHIVNTESATATGQLPDKEGQMYHVQNEDFYLIPTAEVPITNFYRDEVLDEKDLPIKMCGHTPCFRREAGSWGKHVRGLNRLHQFDKVEIVKWAHPDNSFEELESLREDAERILEKLEIPYRTLLMCSGDIGFPHAKQYDLEVWSQGQKTWLEVSSCSNFTDFQARRAGIRFRPKTGGKAQVVHTLNGSALAIPRVLAVILENNYEKENNRIRIPKAIQSYFGAEYLELPSE